MRLAARSVSRAYPGTLALDHVDFVVREAQVNVLIGENGAGKSTLVKILAGEERPTSGAVELDGREIRMGSSRDAARLGIAMIHQELNLLRNLSVTENIFMAREKTRHGIIDAAAQERETRELLERLEQTIDPRTQVGDLPLGQQQIVEIAKALARDVRVLIMDEPTSALSTAEIAVLFRLIRDLKAHGVSIVYISHRLEELLTIGDFVTVLRDGRRVAEAEAAQVNVAWIVEKMTGGAIPVRTSGTAAPARAPILEADLDGVRLHAAPGEIVGVYGLMGAGRTELFQTLIGLDRERHGTILLNGAPIERLSLVERMRRGLALVPEDRQHSGIAPNLTVAANITLASLRASTRGFYLSPALERRQAEGAVRDLHIRTVGTAGPITSLSGGNQQKVIVARMLLTRPKVLLLDEPSRGVDIGARAEIFEIIRRLAADDIAVVFASSEIQEVLALATRIYVMASGRVTAEMAAESATAEALVTAAAPLAQSGVCR